MVKKNNEAFTEEGNINPLNRILNYGGKKIPIGMPLLKRMLALQQAQ